MLDIHNKRKPTTLDASPLETGETSTTVSPVETSQSLLRRLWRIVKRYPIPLGSVALLVVSLVLWLAGRGAIANWMLLAVGPLGGRPRLWEKFHDSLHKEVSIDVIAAFALTRPLPLGEYPAGGLLVLVACRAEGPG